VLIISIFCFHLLFILNNCDNNTYLCSIIRNMQFYLDDLCNMSHICSCSAIQLQFIWLFIDPSKKINFFILIIFNLRLSLLLLYIFFFLFNIMFSNFIYFFLGFYLYFFVIKFPTFFFIKSFIAYFLNI
jgi:hypothetical protein